ncbi:diguanylate cyclase [Bordetella sp. 2513F-2]
MTSKPVRLRSLILAACLFFVAVAVAGMFYASYVVKRQVLLQDIRSANQMFAERLAQVTENYVSSCRRLLATAVQSIQGQPDSFAAQRVLDGLATASDLFNVLVMVDAAGQVRATAPRGAHAGPAHASLAVAAADAAATVVPPPTSRAFRDSAGRWVVALVHPLRDADGGPGGYVAGYIYLHDGVILRGILGPQDFHGGVYSYAFDREGMILYHPDPSLIGVEVRQPITETVLKGGSGAMRYVNRRGIDMVAGYAYVPAVEWGVVVQSPAEEILARADALQWRTLLYASPVGLLLLLGSWWMSRLIARPLNQLALAASRLEAPGMEGTVRSIRGWYLEAAELRRALLKSIASVTQQMGTLQRATATDPMTGLLNRRGLEAGLAHVFGPHRRAAVVTLDIDHFKRINDTYGHPYGDQVLRQLAMILQANARSEDLAARLGGEEFVVVLPDADGEAGMRLAERLRLLVADAEMPNGVRLTISLGVACSPEHGTRFDTVYACADQALYLAKVQGRNRSRLYTGPVAGPAA